MIDFKGDKDLLISLAEARPITSDEYNLLESYANMGMIRFGFSFSKKEI